MDHELNESYEFEVAKTGKEKKDEMRGVVDIFSQKLHLGASAKIAVLNVGDVCSYVKEASEFSIRFLHEPDPLDPAHSGIHDTIQDEMLIGELIAEKVGDTHPVKAFLTT